MSARRKKRKKKPEKDAHLEKQQRRNDHGGGAKLQLLSSLGSQIALGVVFVVFLTLAFRSWDKNDRIHALWYALGAWVSVGLGAVLFAQEHLISEPATPVSGPAFSIQTVTRLQSVTASSPLLFAYKSKYGDTISPIHLALSLRITNLQPIPSVIDSYAVESEVSADRWVKLVRIDVRSGYVFWAAEGLEKAIRLNFNANGLDFLLFRRPLHVHETVQGWTFFEVPLVGIPATGRLRIQVRDAVGAEFTYTEPTAKPLTSPSDAVQGDLLQVAPGFADISRYRFIYYSESNK